MYRRLLAVLIIVAGTTLIVSASSKLVMSWRNPNYAATKKFQRVLALGFSNNLEVRVDFEDALAAELTSKGYQAIPGNSILLRPPGTTLDLNYLREQIQANQIDAVVVSRLIKIDNTITYYPGDAYVVPFPYYNTFYGYYGALYPVVYSPGYLQKEKKVRVETNLYFVNGAPDGQLVWTGMTDTFNPSNVNKSIKGLVNLLVTKMEKEQAL
jgi:ABC-type antimicrobial peptide transport system permease subunit